MLQAQAFDNVAGVPDDVLELFRQDFRYIGADGVRRNKVRDPLEDVTERLLRYVIDGAGADPGDIKLNSSYSSYSSHDPDREAREFRWRIYDRWDELPAATLVRFGQTLAAGSACIDRAPRLDLSKTHAWVEALIRDLVGVSISNAGPFPKTPTPHPNGSMERLATVMAADGLPVETLILSAFTTLTAVKGSGLMPADASNFVAALAGFGAELTRRKETLKGVFLDKRPPQKLRALALLEAVAPQHRMAFAEELAGLALDGATKVRDAATLLVKALGTRAEPHLRARAIDGKPEQRALALRLMWESNFEGARTFVVERGDSDVAASVKKTVDTLRDSSERSQPSLLALAPNVKAQTAGPDLETPTSPEAQRLLKAWMLNAHAETKANTDPAHRHHLVPVERLEDLVALVDVSDPRTAPTADGVLKESYWWLWRWEEEKKYSNFLQWMEAPGVRPIHIAKFLLCAGQIHSSSEP